MRPYRHFESRAADHEPAEGPAHPPAFVEQPHPLACASHRQPRPVVIVQPRLQRPIRPSRKTICMRRTLAAPLVPPRTIRRRQVICLPIPNAANFPVMCLAASPWMRPREWSRPVPPRTSLAMELPNHPRMRSPMEKPQILRLTPTPTPTWTSPDRPWYPHGGDGHPRPGDRLLRAL